MAINGLPNLSSLNLQGCPGVTQLNSDHPAALALAARLANAPDRTLHDLGSLTLSGCRQLSGSTLNAVVHWCGRLHDLQLAECEGLTEEDLIQSVKRLPTLHVINLSKLPHLRAIDLVVQSIASTCPDLIYANLSGTAAFSDGKYFCHPEVEQLLTDGIAFSGVLRIAATLPTTADSACK